MPARGTPPLALIGETDANGWRTPFAFVNLPVEK